MTVALSDLPRCLLRTGKISRSTTTRWQQGWPRCLKEHPTRCAVVRCLVPAEKPDDVSLIGRVLDDLHVSSREVECVSESDEVLRQYRV